MKKRFGSLHHGYLETLYIPLKIKFTIAERIMNFYLPFSNALTSLEGRKKYLAFPVTIEAISEPLWGTA